MTLDFYHKNIVVIVRIIKTMDTFEKLFEDKLPDFYHGFYN